MKTLEGLFQSPVAFDSAIAEQLRVSLIENLQGLANISADVDLRSTGRYISRLLEGEGIPYTHNRVVGIIRDITIRLEEDLRSRLFLCVPVHLQGYLAQYPFGPDVAERFKSAKYHVEEASLCLVFGRNTACVLHLMMVLQLGLDALARKLDVSFERSNWDTIINEIEVKIRAIQIGNVKTARWEEDRTFFSEAAIQFRHFKDAWRNHAAHGRMNYVQPDKAARIYDHVREFMQHLATRLSEEPINTRPPSP